MKTIMLPYKTTENLEPILRQYSSVVRYAYNRFYEGNEKKEVRHSCKKMNNIDLLVAYLFYCAIDDAEDIYKKSGNEKVIFGGKDNFYNKTKGKISKEEYRYKRLMPLCSQGNVIKKGNPLFKLDIIDNNQIIFKLNRNRHIILELPKLRDNIKEELYKLQELNKVKQGEKGYKFTVRLDLDNIYISFEEFKNEPTELYDPADLDENRCLGIDMNPENIGISILENEEIIYAQEFSLSQIFDEIFKEKLSSDSPKMKYFHNKLNHETIEICKSIVELAKRYKCKTVFIEDLRFKKATSNRFSNRKIKNLWKKNLFVKNLTKRLKEDGINLYEINPKYSSFIGNMMYDYTDPINASIEIARRGYEVVIKDNSKGFFPDLVVKHRWKEMATAYTDWEEFFAEIKNQKLRYRVSLDECKHKYRVFQQNSTRKSMVKNYVFYG